MSTDCVNASSVNIWLKNKINRYLIRAGWDGKLLLSVKKNLVKYC